MKPIRFLFLLGIFALPSFAAQARNETVENALKNRPEFSSFYQGLVSTGVIEELQPGRPYTILAPDNQAFDKITPQRYPCFYSAACRADVAQVLRHHIIAGEYDLEHQNALFSINRRHIPVGEPTNGRYLVDGHRVLSTHQLLGSMLYRIDGVIANENELARFW